MTIENTNPDELQEVLDEVLPDPEVQLSESEEPFATRSVA